jgi:hypothetical protein
MTESKSDLKTEESMVTFTVKGAGLDIDGISQNLGLIPSHTHRAGDRVFKSASDRRYDQDMWAFGSELARTESFDTHIKWLAQQLRPHHDFIRSLKDVAEVYMVCSFIMRDWEAGFSISSEALAIFTELGIDLDLSLLVMDSNPKD